MTEDQLEQETLTWLQGVGYTHLYGPDIAHDGPQPERSHYRQVALPFRLREAILKLNPDIPGAAPSLATTSTSMTCSSPRKMAPRWRSMTSRA